MKKLIVFIMILISLFPLLFIKQKQCELLNLKGIMQVCLVSKEKYQNFDALYCGDLVFNYCSLSEAKRNLDKIQNSNAIQIYLQDVEIENLLKDLKCFEYQKNYVADMTVYVGWTPYFDDFVYVDNKKVNVEIALSDKGIVAGFPAILSGF